MPDPYELLDSFLAQNPPMDAPLARKRGQMPPPPKPREAWTPPDQGPMKFENLGQDTGITLKQPPPQPPNSIDISKTLDATRPAPPKPPVRQKSAGVKDLELGFRAGLGDAASLPARLTAQTPGAPPVTREIAQQMEQEIAPTPEEMEGRTSTGSKILQGIGRAPVDIAKYSVARSTPLGMAAMDAAEAASRGQSLEDVAKSGLKGAAMGGALEALSPFGRAVKMPGAAAIGAGATAAEGGDLSDIIASGVTMGGLAGIHGKPKAGAAPRGSLEEVAAGERAAAFVPKGEPLPKRPNGLRMLQVPEGTFFYDPRVTDSKAILKAIDTDTVADILGDTSRDIPVDRSDRNGNEPIRPREPRPSNEPPVLGQQALEKTERDATLASGANYPAVEEERNSTTRRRLTDPVERPDGVLAPNPQQHQLSPQERQVGLLERLREEGQQYTGQGQALSRMDKWEQRSGSDRRNSKPIQPQRPQQKAPAAPVKTVRLYRGEMIPGSGTPVPQWVTNNFGGNNARGRWFTQDEDLARTYALDASNDARAGTPRVRYVDIPEAELEAYRASNQPKYAKFSRNPTEEFLLPRHIANKAAEIPQGTFRRLPLFSAINVLSRADADQARALLPVFAEHLSKADPRELKQFEPELDALGARLGELGVIEIERPTPYRKR